MKKLKLGQLKLGSKEALSREQLKNVLGGFDGSGECGAGLFRCTCDSNCCGHISICVGSIATCYNACTI